MSISTPPPASAEELEDIFTRACAAHESGRLDEAETMYRDLLALIPTAAILHYNLGLICFERKQFEQARDCFIQAETYNNGDPDTLFNLALSLKQCGEIEDAIGIYLQVLDRDPDHVDCLYNLAGCYRDLRDHTKAIATYHRVLELQPSHPAATNNLAYVYHLIADTSMAIHFYRKVLELTPSHEGALHMLASLTGQQAETSPEAYVREVFDNYSDHYEESLLVELEYRVPRKLREVLDQLKIRKDRFEHGIDLGCGTGISGESFVDLVAHLEGIDLSEKMIALAERKKIYAKLYVGNILSHLCQAQSQYDLLLAADVFAYIGDLRELFSTARQSCRADGVFCFSVETTQEGDFHLQSTGRFAHSPTYIRQLAAATGWSVLHTTPTSLRKERDGWIKGDLWFLQPN